jgi:UDP-2,4-diacetamido-2,4,6-trideoxy-beta-L-altropyranose hydrolase
LYAKNSQKIKVLIKTDGNNKIGMGHIYRCIALSEELKINSKIQFIIPRNSNIEKKLNKFGTCYFSPNDETEEIKLIKELSPDIIIIDVLSKYFQYGNLFLKKIKTFSRLLVMLDYIQSGSKYADISFHSLFYPRKKFCKNTFSGLEYVIIGKKFLESKKSYSFKKNINSIIIFQGGADTKCFSPKILKSLKSLPSNIKLTLIVGNKFQCWTELNKTLKLIQKKINILYDVKNISNEMKNHDLAISAGGNTLLELLAIGIPSLIICGEQHEMQIAKILSSKKLALNLGYGKILSQKLILEKTKNFVKNYNKRKLLSTNSRKIIDGNGTKRVTNIIYQTFTEKNLI